MDERLRRLAWLLSLGFLAVIGFASHSFAQSTVGLAEDQAVMQEDLKQKANDLTLEAFARYRRLDYVGAQDLLEKALSIVEQLYPEDQFPQGHPDLVLVLNNLAAVLNVQGEYGQARAYFERSLQIDKRLYPANAYPDGHSEIAASLNNLGAVLLAQGDYEGARRYRQDALAMYRRLYRKDKYPDGHPKVALALSNLGFVLYSQGELEQSRRYHEKALKMRRRLSSEDQFPQGYSELAMSLNNIGAVLNAQGEHQQARQHHEQALAIRRRLYSKDQYPEGHPDLSMSLSNVGGTLKLQGKLDDAQTYFEEALWVDRQLYPASRFPQGHPELALSLNNLGFVLHARGEYEEAKAYLEQSLAIYEGLYPDTRYPGGHPDLAMSLNNLGSLLHAQGNLDLAGKYHHRALAVRERLYGSDDYPHGHPELAASLNNLATTLIAQGHNQQAIEHLDRAARMNEKLADLFISVVSEAEALNFVAQHLRAPNLLLSTWQDTGRPDDDLYARVWTRKGVIHRLMARRQAAALASGDPQIDQSYQRYLGARRDISRLALVRADPDPEKSTTRRARLLALINRKEELERELAAKVPQFRRQLEQKNRSHKDLISHLPPDSAFIDLLEYSRFRLEPKKPVKEDDGRLRSYVAFVLLPGQPALRVELGAAGPINEAVRSWRKEIAMGQDRLAAEELRSLTWDLLEKHLPDGLTRVYISPDSALTRVPWSALPSKDKDRVLLEDYAFATVPYGSFLLERLTAEPAPRDKTDVILALGDVNYDEAPIQEESPALSVHREAVRPERRIVWPSLPGTKRELEILVDAAGNRKLLRLEGSSVVDDRVLAQLPKARWAHLGTHGFFADAKFRSVLDIDPDVFSPGPIAVTRERKTPGGRNPLVLSGLVLAGANLPRRTDAFGIPRSDGGILTAEAIAGLPLPDLELAVLSACETGLGEVAGGEGVFGLQRAFHMAGTHNVIASLWKVSDAATAALMKLFYHELWVRKKPPMIALRDAQLGVYLQPENIDALARLRGPDFEKVVELVDQGGGKARRKTTPAKYWAAFVLSGAG